MHKLSRNDPCWCGSGKKYKQCHLKQDRATLRRRRREGANTPDITIKTEEQVSIQDENKTRQVEIARKNRERAVLVETERVEKDRALEAISRERETALQTIAKDKELEKERKEIQERLTRAGFDTQGADGVIGDKTTAAIRAYEMAKGLNVTGIASKALLAHLRR